jgi:hypothetical protein
VLPLSSTDSRRVKSITQIPSYRWYQATIFALMGKKKLVLKKKLPYQIDFSLKEQSFPFCTTPDSFFIFVLFSLSSFTDELNFPLLIPLIQWKKVRLSIN